jgi:hypothetical protein
VQVNYRRLALDPGGTTGWACYDALFMPDPERDGKPKLVEQMLTVGHIGPQPHHKALYNFLEDRRIGNFELIWESFEFRQGKQRDNIVLDSKEYIGVSKLFCQREGIVGREQTAGAGKGFVSDKKLKVMGWYHPGFKHANDAARHLVYYLVNHERRHDLVDSWRSLA